MNLQLKSFGIGLSMFFIPNTDFHVSTYIPQFLFSQIETQKGSAVGTSTWAILLDSVRNDQVKFELRWVSIRDGFRDNDGLIRKKNNLKGENGLINKRYGITTVHYPVSLDRPSPLGTGPPAGWETDTITYPAKRVFILNPSKLYRLSNINDLKVLDALVDLLDNRDRGWAAHITLCKMLGLDGLGSDLFQTPPNQWWELEGKTQKAKQEWTQYLQEVKPTMVWSPMGGYYKHRAPNGKFVL
jgi:hypothetical protein